MSNWTFLEFFAGGGMARAGLGKEWNCTFANDFDAMKAKVYAANWGTEHFTLKDVANVTLDELPLSSDLVWASFPCQDLSLAGNGFGLGDQAGESRSGCFWSFWQLMAGLKSEARLPPLIVLENVYGSMTANGGRDFAAICRSLSLGGYLFGAVLIDAALFVPQSRPRVFIIAVRDDLEIPEFLIAAEPNSQWHPKAMHSAIARLSEPDLDRWVWWNIKVPTPRRQTLDDVFEAEPTGVEWHTKAETEKIVAMMSAIHRQKLTAMKALGRPVVGTIYKRMRADKYGNRTQRAELRDDGVAGCLRTPGGGSSRQTLLVVNGEFVRSRLLSPREAARLMGLPDSYKLPARYNDAYHVAGDGLVVPVVRYLAEQVLEPLLLANQVPLAIAAE